MTGESRDEPPRSGRGRDRAVEIAGAAALAVALGVWLLSGYSLLPRSDPARWYGFGRDFLAQFAHQELAYGFPLLVALAKALVGPYPAFLVNVPVLVGLVLLLAAFARRCAAQGAGPDPGPSAALAGPLAAALFVLWNGPLLLQLVNPYRDPLSYLALLASALGLLALARPRRRPAWLAAGAGACLAFAVSTRETSVLLAPPLLGFAVAAHRRDPALPFWRPLLAFAGAFALCSVPYLVQNQLVSGQAWVPAQAADAFREAGSVTPGIRTRHLRETGPALLAHVAAHHGPVGWGLLALGIGFAVRRRALGLLALCVPAWIVYAVFYAGYERVVERYLLVLDLFAAPLAAAGAAWALSFALARVGPTAGRRRAVLGLAFAAALAAVWSARAEHSTRMRLDDARRFARHLSVVLPAGASVLGSRPSVDILRCFLDQRVAALRHLVPSRTVVDPALPARVRRVLAEVAPLYFVSRPDPTLAFLRGEADLVEPIVFDPVDYGLERAIGTAKIYLSRVEAWSQLRTSTQVRVEEAGDYVLEVDVGALSKVPRRYAEVVFAGRVLDARPVDRLNFYRVRAEEPGDVRVELRSDLPVPRVLEASLRPLAKAVPLELEGPALLPVAGRFSASFRARPGLDYPTIERAGTVEVPTVDPAGAAFLVLAEAALSSEGRGYRRSLRVSAKGQTLYRGELSWDGRRPSGAHENAGPRAWHRFPVTLALARPIVTGPTTRLHWSLSDDPDDPRRLLALTSLRVRRHPTVRSLRIDFGPRPLPRGVASGFHPPRRGEAGEPPAWRWTDDRARVRLFLAPDPRPGRLEVAYRTGARPRGLPPAEPRFTWNGRPLRGKRRARTRDGLVHVVETFAIPAGWMRQIANLVELRARPWIPRAAGVSDDTRVLGIMWESLRFERLGRP